MNLQKQSPLFLKIHKSYPLPAAPNKIFQYNKLNITQKTTGSISYTQACQKFQKSLKVSIKKIMKCCIIQDFIVLLQPIYINNIKSNTISYLQTIY